MPTVCPFADWRPLPEATSQPPITPRVVIFHTAVGTLRGVEAYFRDRTGIESHLMVGGPWDGPELDGALWQWMDLDRQADANLDANRFAISIETSDNAPASAADLAPWSQNQLATLVRVGNWLADHYRIPRRQCPAWDEAGFGWHAMWGAPSPWTPVAGKVCPGAARIHQLTSIVFPAIFAGRQLQEDDMFTNADAARLQRIEQALNVPGTSSAEEAVNLLFARVRAIEARTAALVDDDRVLTAVQAAHTETLAALAELRPDLTDAQVDAISARLAARLGRLVGTVELHPPAAA